MAIPTLPTRFAAPLLRSASIEAWSRPMGGQGCFHCPLPKACHLLACSWTLSNSTPGLSDWDQDCGSAAAGLARRLPTREGATLPRFPSPSASPAQHAPQERHGQDPASDRGRLFLAPPAQRCYSRRIGRYGKQLGGLKRAAGDGGSKKVSRRATARESAGSSYRRSSVVLSCSGWCRQLDPTGKR